MDTNSRDFDFLNSQIEDSSCQYYTIQEMLSTFSIQDDNFDKSILTSKTSIKKNNVINENDKFNHSINDFRIMHINSRSISKNFDSVESLLQSLTNFSFSVIGISETWLHANSPNLYNIPDYEMVHVDRKEGRAA